MRFTTTLELGGKTATGLEVPDDVVGALGGGKRPKVTVTINGYTYRTTVGVMGGRSLVPVSAEVRAQAGVAAGDVLEVEVALDDAPREVDLPDELAAALAADPVAAAAFERLSYSHRKEHARAVESAKAAETRARRVARTIETLRQGASA